MTTDLNKYNHYWKYCDHCQVKVVICGACSNNSCNGGYGEVDNKTCYACPSAYKMQLEDEGKQTSNWITLSSKQDMLTVDTGFK